MRDYCQNVLFVGPHPSLRGGMASVLEVYSKNISDFNFLPTYYKTKALQRELYFIKAIARLIFILATKKQIKIVHIHVACRGSFIRKSIVVLLSKLFGRKVILHLHGGEFKVYLKESGILKPYILYILNTADELAVLSEEWKTYFDSITKRQKSTVVNNPVMMPAMVKANELDIPIRILYMNHVTLKKGIFDIVETFKKNKAAFTGVFKLNIAGAGSDVDKLNELIAENNLQDLVEYKGWVSGKEKEEMVSGCNIFILTSYFEGLPMSILESMALGKAIISTDVGGIPTIVKPGVNGWLVKPGDNDALTGVMLAIKNDPSVLEQYGKASLTIVQDYAPKNVIRKLNEMYAALISKEPVKAAASV